MVLLKEDTAYCVSKGKHILEFTKDIREVACLNIKDVRITINMIYR